MSGPPVVTGPSAVSGPPAVTGPPVVTAGPVDLPLAARVLQVLAELPAVTDLHLAVGEPLRVRIGGRLSTVGGEPIDTSALLAFAAALSPAWAAGSDDVQGWLRAQSGGAVDGAGTLGVYRLRGNLHLRAGGAFGLVLRRLRDAVPDLDTLGLPVILRRLVDRARGLLLVTGPTGSGKSTTLAALIRHLVCSRPLHVLTLEDPIEYRVDLVDRGGHGSGHGSGYGRDHGREVDSGTDSDSEGDPSAASASACASASAVPMLGRVTVREIGTDAPDFASAVRAALRQDPDVIVIGEIRDRATMHAALAAAETGHLVLATLHTPNASEAVERVLSFFPPDEMPWARSVFANVLVAVVSQALVRKRSDAALTLASELMVNTPAVRQQILQGTIGQLRGIMAQGRRDGHVQMTAQLAERVRRGEIEEADARYVAHPAEEFSYLLQSSQARSGAAPPPAVLP